MDQNNERPLLLNESIKQTVDPSAFKNSVQAQPSRINASTVSKNDSVVVDAQQLSPTLKKKARRYTILQVCSGIGLLISLVVIFALPPLIQKAIVEQAKQQVIMTPDNQGRWAHFPGDTQTVILRNFTFFRLDNQGEFLFQNQKPIFRQFSGFKVQELQDFLDIEYLDNGNFVKVRDWTRFQDWNQGKSLDDKVNILNMGNLGYWSTLKAARPTLLLQQGLALLFTSLEESLVPTLIGSGVNQQFLANSSVTYSSFLSPAGISRDNADFMWSDPAYGLFDKQNLGFWSEAATKCYQNEGNSFIFSEEATVLKNYFTLSDSQIRILMQKMYGYVTNLRKLLLQNHYCAEISMSECTGRYLGIAQLADGWVTGNTPPVSTISPNDTICDDNVTCKGLYPEPYAFAKNVFKISPQLYNKVELNAPVTFSRETVLKWFNYNHSIQQGLDYNTAQNCLLHIGNLDDLWEMGQKFEKNMDPKLLQPIMKRFGLESTAQTLIFWQWIRYVTNDFVLQRGNNANIGVANLFTNGFYNEFSNLKDNLQRFLLTKMLNKQLSKIECHDFFEKALDEQNNPQLVNALCHAYPDIHSQDFAMTMVDTCERKYGKEWQTIKGLGVGLTSMENLCDTAGTDNIGGRLHLYKIQLDSTYHCDVTPNPYCSDFQLALLQWHNSSVTLNPPRSLPQLESTSSFSMWKKDVKAIQYEHFIRKYIAKDQQNKFPRYSLRDLFGKFTFESLFSTNLLVKQLGEKSIDKYFYKYIRYVCIFITLNGFTTTRTPRQILFGYEDEFLATVKNTYPPFGGDPSAPSVIAFNDLNNTKENSTQTIVFKTGKSDYRDVYQNYQINGFKYLVNNYTFFNGNETVWEWRSPWAEKDYFYGTTAKIFAPDQFEADNLSLLIPQVQRYGSNYFHNETEKVERFGMQLYKGLLNARIGQLSPANDKYYQTIANVFNVTSIYGFPLYITKNHFMNATDWLQKVEIFNQDQSIHYKDISPWDDTFIIVQPYTGVSFQSCIYLQNNYYHTPDPLYDYPTDVLLPIFSIARSGNLTQSKFHQLYDPLVLAFTIKKVAVYVGIGLAVIFVGLLVFATLKKRKLPNYEPKSSQLGISLQEYKSQQRMPSITQEMVRADQQE